MTSGTEKPAPAFTSITSPISPGELWMRSSRTGRYVVVTARPVPAPIAAAAKTIK
jgi:hypothetical protein